MSLFKLDKSPEIVEERNGFRAHSDKGSVMYFMEKPSLKEFEAKFSEIKESDYLLFKTDGKCSLHEMIEVILHKIGPSKLTLCTWKITEEPLRALVDLIHKGFITEINALFDYRIEETTPQAFQLALGMASKIKLGKVHAKVLVLENEKYSISIIGSANLTTNPRIEAGVLFTQKSCAEFNRNWILETINEPSK